MFEASYFLREPHQSVAIHGHTDHMDENPVASYNIYRMLSLVAPVFTEHFMPK